MLGSRSLFRGWRDIGPRPPTRLLASAMWVELPVDTWLQSWGILQVADKFSRDFMSILFLEAELQIRACLPRYDEGRRCLSIASSWRASVKWILQNCLTMIEILPLWPGTNFWWIWEIKVRFRCTSNRVSLNLNSPERGSKRGLCLVNVWPFSSNRSRRG